ncbi:MAG TPA: TPM domain-containing protein [Candidatus Binatia bacterium]|nr:TPM domain-containing protein [Candidatus Binatia bacterium]
MLGGLVPAVGRGAPAAEPPVPTPQGFVTDLAHVIPPATAAKITALLEELRAKTGAEIAVVTVDTTAPLDDFTYAMRIADVWRPGRKREDTGVVFLVAVKDRKLRILVGYGLEGILPDGLVGEIEDREIVPAFRAGRLDEGVWRGVAALARRIAEARGVTLTGVPPPRPTGPAPVPLPGWVVLGGALVLLLLVLYGASRPRRFRGGFSPFGYGGWGGFGGFGRGGFGGGGGGFGGFGGGSFGGGGAGRSW